MIPRLLSILLLCASCGDDSPPLDGGPIGDAGGDAFVPPPAGDRIGYFGPEPSFFEVLLANESAAPVDGFHFGGHRTGFTWPIPCAGDFDGDGFDEVGFYDPRARAFHLDLSGGETVVAFPGPTGLPLVGDWDGDGTDGLGIYDPLTGRASLADASGSVIETVDGPVGPFAFAADLDGDGVDGIVYYDGSVFETRAPDATTVRLDAPDGGYPFAFDGDGDGADGVGILDVAAQSFRLFTTLDAAAPPTIVEPPIVSWVRVPIAGHFRATVPRPLDTGYPFETVDPAPLGIDGARLAEAERAFDGMPNLHSFLVLKEGALAHEAYFHGNRPEIAHNMKSVSKSILATLLGIAGADGTFPDGVPIASYLSSIADDGDPRRERILWSHLVTMTSGLAWNEDLIGDWYENDDWVAAAFTAPMTGEPGAAFNYSTGNTHIASAILTAETGMGTDVFAAERLLAPLGIVAERWDRDAGGTPFGGAEVTMRPRDLARFGQLYLEDGAPGGTRVVDQAILDLVRTEYIDGIDGNLRYGAWWWMRTFGTADAYFAWGFGGQFVFVFPTLDAVVVVTSRSDVTGATSASVSDSIFDVLANHVVPALGG